MSKGLGAYFAFTEEHRAEEREKLLKGREEGAKVSVADVAKALGSRWKTLSEEEKQKYKDTAAAKAKAKEQEKEANREAGGAAGEADAEGKESKKKEVRLLDGLLALSIVKRIITSDEDVARISADGLVMVAAAADQFLGLLAQRAAAVARGSKRRTIRLEDFVQVWVDEVLGYELAGDSNYSAER